MVAHAAPVDAAPADTAPVEPAEDPAPDDGDFWDESMVESDEIAAPGGFHAQVSWLTMTGTMHSAVKLSFTTASGTLELRGDEFADESATDPLHAEALPLIERVDAIGAQRWIALGWSSPGEGMQTVTAWIVEEGATGPRVVDSLAWSTDRRHAGFGIEAKTGAIGIPLPNGGDLHNESEWHLRHGADVLPLEDVRKRRAGVAKVRDFFGPPMGASPSERGWSGRFVWFDVAKQFEQRK